MFAPQQQMQIDPLPPDHRLDDRALLEKANSLERRNVRPWLAQNPGELGEDLETYYKSLIAQQYRIVSGDYGRTRQIAGVPPFKVMEKALLTTTAGGFNPLFSYAAIAGISVEANTWNMMPKVSWRTRTLGWRNKTAAAIASLVGQPEGVAMPADIDPTWVEVQPTIKETLQATGVSIRAREAATIADMITENQHVASTLEDLMRAQNADLMGAVFGVEGDHVERLRNLIGSNAELTGKTGGANNADPWLNIDRDAGASWADANVLHASGVDRDLEISLIDQLFQNQRQFWDSMANKVYLTGDTTLRVWSELEEAKERIGETRVQFTVGGIQSVKGNDAGVVLSGYRGDPIIPDSASRWRRSAWQT